MQNPPFWSRKSHEFQYKSLPRRAVNCKRCGEPKTQDAVAYVPTPVNMYTQFRPRIRGKLWLFLCVHVHRSRVYVSEARSTRYFRSSANLVAISDSASFTITPTKVRRFWFTIHRFEHTIPRFQHNFLVFDTKFIVFTHPLLVFRPRCTVNSWFKTMILYSKWWISLLKMMNFAHLYGEFRRALSSR